MAPESIAIATSFATRTGRGRRPVRRLRLARRYVIPHNLKRATIARRLRRLEDRLGVAEPTAADQEECARVLAILDEGRRRYAGLCGEPAPAPHIEDWLGSVRPARGPLSIDLVTEVLHAGRQRARMRAIAHSE